MLSGFSFGDGGAGDGSQDYDARHPHSLLPDATVVEPSPGCATGNTTITGKVFDPAGKNPLYGIVVYVPAGPVSPLATGASCDACGSLYTGGVLASAVTGTDGSFTLSNIPVGDASATIPLVIQVGKWRKQIPALAIQPCRTTALVDGTLTLPKNHTDPGNDLPSIAISTGGADTLECLLRRVGLDAAEYGPGASGPGHIHIFTGSSGGSPNVVPGSGGGYYGLAPTTNPAAPNSYEALWDSTADLLPYDIILLSCEGNPTSSVTATSQQNLVDYTTAGGRVFASHYQYAWLHTGPFGADPLADWTTPDGGAGAAPDGGLLAIGPPNHAYGTILTSFPKGKALDAWLGNVGALTAGQLAIAQPRFDVGYDPALKASETWITVPNPTSTTSGEYLSFNTPVTATIAADAGPQCGRVVFSDIHVSGAVTPADYTGASETVPDGCTNAALTPQEAALEFMLFDLSSCVVPDSQPPPPPPPPSK